jgi:hypothetical protein
MLNLLELRVLGLGFRLPLCLHNPYIKDTEILSCKLAPDCNMYQTSVYLIKTASGADKALLCAKSAILIETSTGRVFDRCSFAKSNELSLSEYIQTYPSPALAHTEKFWTSNHSPKQGNGHFPIILFRPIDAVLTDDWKPQMTGPMIGTNVI